jgi:hypothetical protein
LLGGGDAAAAAEELIASNAPRNEPKSAFMRIPSVDELGTAA